MIRGNEKGSVGRRWDGKEEEVKGQVQRKGRRMERRKASNMEVKAAEILKI